MQIVIVSAENETVTLSLVDSKRRLEEIRAAAVSLNETLFECITNLDPDDEFASVEDRIAAAEKIWKAERDSDRAWAAYVQALVRYRWDVEQARKAGIVI